MKALAGEVGMTETGLHRALKNKSLKVKTLERISEVLEVPIAFLFGEEQRLEEERRKYKRENKELEERVEAVERRLDELLRSKE